MPTNKCPDCGTEPGAPHVSKIEHPDIYKQGPTEEMYVKWDTYIQSLGGPLVWTGEWWGAKECREYGWFSKFLEGVGWTRCPSDDSEGTPDLTRLVTCANWNRQQRRWVRTP